MSHYSLEELIARWRREELTVEQMVGQILQALYTQQQRLRDLERRLPSLDDREMTSSHRQR